MNPANYSTASWQLALYAVFYLFSVVAIGVTSYVSGQQTLLENLTVENGFYELTSVLVLLVLCIYCLSQGFKNKSENLISNFVKTLWLVIGSLAFVAAGEEISWGQHLFGFSSNEFFQEHNLQEETNLHNFVPGHVFAGSISILVYSVFVFAPILLWLFPDLLQFLGKLIKPLASLIPTFMPSLHISLMMCFSGTLQLYFVETSFVSTIGLILALVCMAVIIWRIEAFRTPEHMVHWLAVVAAMAFFMLNNHVFSFFNMQAEMREFFIMLIGMFWVMEWTNRVLVQNSSGNTK